MNKERVQKYILDGLIWIDQGVNWLLGGSPDHTLSGRVGYNALKGKQWAICWQEVINTIFFWDEDHCFESIEWVIMQREYPSDDVDALKKRYTRG